MEINRPTLKQNWTTSILREEVANWNAAVTGHRQVPVYVTETEAQRQYSNPNTKRIEHLRDIEQNRYGRFAYTPDRTPPNGILPTYNAAAYPEVIPRFRLPKVAL